MSSPDPYLALSQIICGIPPFPAHCLTRNCRVMFSSAATTTAQIRARIYLAFMCCGLFPSPLRSLVADLHHYSLSPRVERVNSSNDSTKPSMVARRHYCLPFSKERWQKITETFMLHRAILRATKNNKCESTFLRCKHKTKDVELYTAVSGPYDQSGSFSLSCAHFCASKLNLAVAYACDPWHVSRVKDLLRGSPEVAAHPLLMVRVFAELQLNQMQQLVDEALGTGDQNGHLFGPTREAKGLDKWDINLNLVAGVTQARKVEEQLRTTMVHLKEMASRIDEQRQAKVEGTAGVEAGTPSWIAGTDRFKFRFRDINIELEGMIAQSRVVAEEQRYRSDMVSAGAVVIS